MHRRLQDADFVNDAWIPNNCDITHVKFGEEVMCKCITFLLLENFLYQRDDLVSSDDLDGGGSTL